MTTVSAKPYKKKKKDHTLINGEFCVPIVHWMLYLHQSRVSMLKNLGMYKPGYAFHLLNHYICSLRQTAQAQHNIPLSKSMLNICNQPYRFLIEQACNRSPSCRRHLEFVFIYSLVYYQRVTPSIIQLSLIFNVLLIFSSLIGMKMVWVKS